LEMGWGMKTFPRRMEGNQVRRPEGGGESEAIEHILPSPPGLPAGDCLDHSTFYLIHIKLIALSVVHHLLLSFMVGRELDLH